MFPTNRCVPVASVSESGEKTLPGAARFLQTGYFRQIVARYEKYILCSRTLQAIACLSLTEPRKPSGARTHSVFPTNRCVPVASVSESGEKTLPGAARFLQTGYFRQIVARYEKYILCSRTLQAIACLSLTEPRKPSGARTHSVFPTNRCVPVASVSESGEKTLPGAARFLQTGYFRQIVARYEKYILCSRTLQAIACLSLTEPRKPSGARTHSVFPTNRCVPVASVSESGEKTLPGAARFLQTGYFRQIVARYEKYILCSRTLQAIACLSLTEPRKPSGARTHSVFPTNRCVPVASVSESGEKTLPGAARFLQTGYFRQIVARYEKYILCSRTVQAIACLSLTEPRKPSRRTHTLSVSDEPLRAGCVGF